MLAGFPYLTYLVLGPIGAALVVATLPRHRLVAIRTVGAIGVAGTMALAITVLVLFKAGIPGYQLATFHRWVPSLGIAWSLGVDGISLFLVLLTVFLVPLAIYGAPERVNEKGYLAWMLLLESGCLGAFCARDVLVFFAFFELTLVPTYFLIAGWGEERRAAAATKFFVYTFVASAFMLVGIVALVAIHASQTGVTTFDITALGATHLSGTAGVLLLLAFTAAFVVKAPVFPFHTWSPDAYAESPAGASVLLGGVMAKLGTYGIIRFDLELFPHATRTLAPLFLTLGVIGILYGAIVAAVQRNLKRLVAYSSLAHMGFIVLGLFALSGEAVSGAVLQMVNHGVYTAGLFLLIAAIARRTGSVDVGRLSGLQRTLPVLAACFTVVMLASIGVPGLNGFVGEFLILAGTFLTHRWWAVVAIVGVILAAVYFLWAYQEAFHGHPTEELEGGGDAPQSARDLGWRERAVIAPIIVAIVFLGVYPKPVLDRINPTVDTLVARVALLGGPDAPPSGPVISGVPVGGPVGPAQSTGASK
jgi:NADH-quinone oxidoreductase subunit M